MLNDYIINMLLLVAMTFIGGHMMKEIKVRKFSLIFTKWAVGIFCGFIGILLIVYSIPIKETHTLIDLRAYSVMIASYAGGILSAVISASIIILYRVIVYEKNISTVFAVIQMMLYLLTFYVIDKMVKLRWKKWFYKTFVQMIIILGSYAYLIKDVENCSVILLLYTVFLVITGVLEYLMLEYVRISNELYIRYKNDSTIDFLTGLDNTRQFDTILNRAFERVLQNKETLSCLMIDIDHFKKVNDTYGHAAGDLVLKELAIILKQNIRTVDIAARIGGEEFCALLFNCSKELTFEIAERINKSVEKHDFPIDEKSKIHITVSVGVSMYPEITSNLDTLKELADNALYKAKRSGRNKVLSSEEGSLA